MAQVAIQNLNKKFDEVHAVKDVNLAIHDKEFMVLVGPSGCGKTTTLRMVAGLEIDHLGAHPDRRQGDQRIAADGSRHRDGVPELRALPAYERLRQHGLRPQDAEIRPRRHRPAGAGRGRDPRHPGSAQAQAAAIVGRPAPARGARPGHRAPSAGVPVRRAVVQPRRQIARADAGRAEEAARPARHHRGLCDPRPGRGDDPRRPRRRHEGRAGAAGRRAARALQRAGQPVCRRLYRLAGDEFRDRQGRARTTVRYGPRTRASASRCRRSSPAGSAAISVRKPRSASVRRICTSPPTPIRPISASTPWSRSSSSSAPRSCSMSRSARASMVASVEPSHPRQGPRPAAPRAEPGAAAFFRQRVRSGDLNREKNMARIDRRRLLQLSGAGGSSPRSWAPAGRPPLPRARRCIGSNSSISCRSPTSCCAARSPSSARRTSASSSSSRPSTATRSRRASPRRSSRRPAPTS